MWSNLLEGCLVGKRWKGGQVLLNCYWMPPPPLSHFCLPPSRSQGNLQGPSSSPPGYIGKADEPPELFALIIDKLLNLAMYSRSHLHLARGDSSGPHEVVSTWICLRAAPTCLVVARSQTGECFSYFLFSLSLPHFIPVSQLVEKSVLRVDNRQLLAAMPEELEILNLKFMFQELVIILDIKHTL